MRKEGSECILTSWKRENARGAGRQQCTVEYKQSGCERLGQVKREVNRHENNAPIINS